MQIHDNYYNHHQAQALTNISWSIIQVTCRDRKGHHHQNNKYKGGGEFASAKQLVYYSTCSVKINSSGEQGQSQRQCPQNQLLRTTDWKQKTVQPTWWELAQLHCPVHWHSSWAPTKPLCQTCLIYKFDLSDARINCAQSLVWLPWEKEKKEKEKEKKSVFKSAAQWALRGCYFEHDYYTEVFFFTHRWSNIWFSIKFWIKRFVFQWKMHVLLWNTVPW